MREQPRYALTTAAALAAAAVLAAAAPAAAPLSGATFSGRTAQGTAVSFTLGAGRRLTSFSFGAGYSCAKGAGGRRWRLRRGRRAPIAVSGSGFARTFKAATALQSDRGARLGAGRASFRVTGTFGAVTVRNFVRTQVAHGTLRARFTSGGGQTCTSGPVRWTALSRRGEQTPRDR